MDNGHAARIFWGLGGWELWTYPLSYCGAISNIPKFSFRAYTWNVDTQQGHRKWKSLALMQNAVTKIMPFPSSHYVFTQEEVHGPWLVAILVFLLVRHGLSHGLHVKCFVGIHVRERRKPWHFNVFLYPSQRADPFVGGFPVGCKCAPCELLVTVARVPR